MHVYDSKQLKTPAQATNNLRQSQEASLSLPAVPFLTAQLRPVYPAQAKSPLVMQFGNKDVRQPPPVNIPFIDNAFQSKLGLWDKSKLPEGCTVFVYAAGSYGREELQPASDLDYYIMVQGTDPGFDVPLSIREYMGKVLPVDGKEWQLEYEGFTYSLLSKKSTPTVVTGRLLWKIGNENENLSNKYGGIDPAIKIPHVIDDLNEALTKGKKKVKSILYQPFLKGLIILGKSKGIQSLNPYTILEALHIEQKDDLFAGYYSIETTEDRKDAERNVTKDEQKAIGILINLLSNVKENK